jgi:hypothetical protein
VVLTAARRSDTFAMRDEAILVARNYRDACVAPPEYKRINQGYLEVRTCSLQRLMERSGRGIGLNDSGALSLHMFNEVVLLFLSIC